MMGKRIKITLTAFIILIILGASFLVFTFHTNANPNVAYIISEKEETQDNTNTFRFVNRLLLNDFSVYWVAEKTEVQEGALILDAGDFIIPQQVNSIAASAKDLLGRYIDTLSEELNVKVEKVNFDFSVEAFPLKKPNIAVYYGDGTTGGALEHLQPLENADFAGSILNSTQVGTEDLSQFNVLTFAGGGPYENYLDQNAILKIENFVAGGGGYVGTCGGSVFGIYMELLPVHIMEGLLYPQYSEYANLRGPLVLSLTDDSPLTSGYTGFMNCVYLMGPFFDQVGDNATVIARLNSTTPETQTFFPELFYAYNFSKNTDSINRAWGTPAVVSGAYGNGNVVLSSVHPEILPESQRFFINCIYYALSGDKVNLNQNTIVKEENSNIGTNFESGVFDENAYSSAINFLQRLKSNAGASSNVMGSYSDVSYQMVGLSSDYLSKYIDDVNSRSANLMPDLGKIKVDYEALEDLKGNQNENISAEAANLQGKIAYLVNVAGVKTDFAGAMDTVSKDLVSQGDILTSITACQNSTLRYQEIVSLYLAEGDTTGLLKNDVDYFLAPLSAQVQMLHIRAEFLTCAAS
jgi:glutamine amidotransferase-like uncharacterized protein